MKRKILSVGHMEFPHGLAQVQRQLLLAKAIELEGSEVTVLCRYGIHEKKDGINDEGVFESIHYVYCSGTSIRPKKYFERNLLKFKGLFNECKYYYNYSKSKQLAGVLVSTNRFHNILFYFLLGKIFRVITVVDNVEFWTSKPQYKGLDRIDKFFYDKFYFLFADKIVCISDFLIKKVSLSKRKHVLKIPSITDFDKFDLKIVTRLIPLRYFLFCGSADYFEILNFVISSFEKLNGDNIYLLLVTQKSEELVRRINGSLAKKNILIRTNIPYEDLINLYLCSEALIIPMRNADQDRARFPHKISEYCAARKPIITNKVGEICNYFDDQNAFLASDFNEQLYANEMHKVLANPATAQKIAYNSFQTGIRYFNYKSYSKSLVRLFDI